MSDTLTLDKDAAHVARLLRSMYGKHRPGKQLEIDLELLKIDILKHMAIKIVLEEIPHLGGEQ